MTCFLFLLLKHSEITLFHFNSYNLSDFEHQQRVQDPRNTAVWLLQRGRKNATNSTLCDLQIPKTKFDPLKYVGILGVLRAQRKWACHAFRFNVNMNICLHPWNVSNNFSRYRNCIELVLVQIFSFISRNSYFCHLTWINYNNILFSFRNSHNRKDYEINVKIMSW